MVDYSVVGFNQRLEDIRRKRAALLKPDVAYMPEEMFQLSDRLAAATMDAIGMLDLHGIKTGERDCVSQHITELAVWGKPKDITSAMLMIDDVDLQYMAMACAVGAGEHARQNTIAIVESAILPPNLLKKIANRSRQVQACASTAALAPVKPAEFDAAGFIDKKISGEPVESLSDLQRGKLPLCRGLNGQS